MFKTLAPLLEHYQQITMTNNSRTDTYRVLITKDTLNLIEKTAVAKNEYLLDLTTNALSFNSHTVDSGFRPDFNLKLKKIQNDLKAGLLVISAQNPTSHGDSL